MTTVAMIFITTLMHQTQVLLIIVRSYSTCTESLCPHVALVVSLKDHNVHATMFSYIRRPQMKKFFLKNKKCSIVSVVATCAKH